MSLSPLLLLFLLSQFTLLLLSLSAGDFAELVVVVVLIGMLTSLSGSKVVDKVMVVVVVMVADAEMVFVQYGI